MDKLKLNALVISTAVLLSPTSAYAESFIDNKQPFFLIEDEYRQAEAWGTCVAAYRLMSLIQKADAPAFAKQLSDLSNGAAIALYMSYMSGIGENANSEELVARNKMGKLLMESIPDTRFTAISSAGELAKHNKEWQDNFLETMDQCHHNLEAQQMFVDAWRSFYASGAYDSE